VLLLSTTAIVSNIESIQQTLGITLEKAYTYSPIPLVWLVSMRSLCVILLIVAHALKYVSAGGSSTQPMTVAEPVKETPIEHPEQPVTITEAEPKPRALPSPKKRTANDNNLERVRLYMAEHQGTSVRQVAKDLELGISTANKWMRQVARE